MVRIDQPRRDKAGGQVNDFVHWPIGRGAFAQSLDPAVANVDPAGLNLGPAGVHGHDDGCVLEENVCRQLAPGENLPE